MREIMLKTKKTGCGINIHTSELQTTLHDRKNNSLNSLNSPPNSTLFLMDFNTFRQISLCSLDNQAMHVMSWKSKYFDNMQLKVFKKYVQQLKDMKIIREIVEDYIIRLDKVTQ